DDAVAYEVRTARAISLNHAGFIQQPCILPDARVLVDDSAPDNCSLPYPDARQSLAEIAAHLLERLIEVGTHHVRRVDLNSFRDPAAHAHDGVCDLRAIDDAAIADDRIIDLRLFDLRRRQIARA